MADVSSSLARRLPIISSAIVAVIVATFVWVAFREVQRVLVQAGGTRARIAATQLADLLSQSAQQRVRDVQRAAQHPDVRDVLQDSSGSRLSAAREALRPTTNQAQPPTELWDSSGRLILTEEGAPPPAAGGRPASPVPASRPPFAPGVGPFEVSNGIVYWPSVAEVAAPPAASGAQAGPLGYVVSRRLLSTSSTSDVIARLVGDGAGIKIGNQTGTVWTDLSRIVSAPPITTSSTDISEYRAASGQERLGARAPIAGTPWAVWADFPRDVIVAPAWEFLWRMLAFGLSFILGAALLVRRLSRRLTVPLNAVTQAAESLAAGKSPSPVVSTRRDEIGRLGAAFNVMAEKVQGVQRDLETRVQERTAGLVDAQAALQRHIAELDEARQELDRFFSLSLDMLCIARGPYFTRVNPAWQGTLGWTPEELTSVPYQTFVHPDDVDVTGERATELTHGVAILSFENRYRHTDGSYRWLHWKAAPLGEHGLIYAAARDVTEQKRLEAAREDHAAKLAAVNEELEAFSYSVSHDLRAPLRHVTGFAALLEERAGDSLDSQARRYVTTIKEAASRMGRLIDDLLGFSRMGRSPLSKRRVSLDSLVSEARREVQPQTEGRDVRWRIHALPDVVADPAMLRLVLINLLSNALKYTQPRERAEIEIGTNGNGTGEVVLFVRDNGVGFDMQYAHKLFGVFQRLHAEEFEGTGIGLANVRRIMHRHGGRAWAEAALDRGATFFIALPAEEGDRVDSGTA